jgi:transposase
MDVVFPACCGIDVHQKSLVACVRIIESAGRVRKEVRTFATTTAALSELAVWLQTLAVTHVAIESTGVFWKPVWHLLETSVTLVLVNPRDVAQVPGRTTDVSDAEWLAQLLQCGVLRGSFVPPRPGRERRDLTRSRTTLEQQRAAVVNRIHKVLEDANITWGTVVTDIDGVSGRAIVHALIDGQTDATALAARAKGRLRKKLASLREAVTGHVTDHHRFLLRRLMTEVRFLDEEIAAFNTRIEEATRPFDDLIVLLDTAPGINRRTAEHVLAEIGADMTIFPTAKHLASWAAICPGHYESAGRQTRGTIRHGNRWLRGTVVQAALAATRKNGSYAAAQFRRIAKRRGSQRAIVAVAHSLLVAAYYIVRDRAPYHDLGAEHFDRVAPEQLTKHYVRRLEQLGIRFGWMQRRDVIFVAGATTPAGMPRRSNADGRFTTGRQPRHIPTRSCSSPHA